MKAIKSKKDLYSGLMFIGIGLIFAVGAFNYPMGTAVRMGPAYFPSILGWLTVTLGVVIAARGFASVEEDPRPTSWRIMGLILFAVVAFGWLVGAVGLVIATVVLIVAAAYAGEEFNLKEVIIECVVLATSVVLIFNKGLGLPFKILPWE